MRISIINWIRNASRTTKNLNRKKVSFSEFSIRNKSSISIHEKFIIIKPSTKSLISNPLGLSSTTKIIATGICKRQSIILLKLTTYHLIRGVSNFSARSLRRRFVMWWHMHETQILVHFRAILYSLIFCRKS